MITAVRPEIDPGIIDLLKRRGYTLEDRLGDRKRRGRSDAIHIGT